MLVRLEAWSNRQQAWILLESFADEESAGKMLIERRSRDPRGSYRILPPDASKKYVR